MSRIEELKEEIKLLERVLELETAIAAVKKSKEVIYPYTPYPCPQPPIVPYTYCNNTGGSQ